MFSANTYQKRRKDLCKVIKKGMVLLPGNMPVPMNYPSNHLRFRQDSSFLYYCGLDYPNLNLVIDADSGESTLFGDDLTVSDIVWEGERTSIQELAKMAGIDHFLQNKELPNSVQSKKESIHYLPQYRADQKSFINRFFNGNGRGSSKKLIQAVIRQRSIKSEEEIIEIEEGLVITAEMHKLAMMLTRPGTKEQTVVGQIEGFALSYGRRMAYPVIFSVRGEILHNNDYFNTMKTGQLVLNDSGAESPLHYASDITRTFPVDGQFNNRQKAIYNIVHEMQSEAFKYCEPGKSYKDAHLKAASIAVEGLKARGLMKGNVKDAVDAGAHALFFPHGLGHMLGLDVHDMEGLGEDLVGYDDKKDRSDQFGLAYLRLAKKLEPGFVLTVEPGIYFIPHLIDQWKADKKHINFINYDALEDYRNFGGIRIEDNIVITKDGYRILGPPIPKTIEEIETLMQENNG
ncbi:MAG: aminopeptidase P family protein [Candidatus Marinimicrobia bacterium]|nr:aminopeptidase P family protein [Candidatus Neomarinimicrobiota bacterium]MBL7009660.1 aminopeptidase P family protein [Candidatus Neomarinimicrobiota bacterium]MBL7029597.1 aminopeptidase P family protein [Candidatus Neomarinimicrobiota bacterium]